MKSPKNNVLILDTETTNTECVTGKIVEVATILYSMDEGSPITHFSSLIEQDSNEAYEFNKIGTDLLKKASSFHLVDAVLDELFSQADFVMAHSASFDLGFMRAEKRLTFDPGRLPWVCSMRHIKWPKSNGKRKLVDLALLHGVPVVGAHRAMTDCDILARMLTRVHEDHELTGWSTGVTGLIHDAALPRVLVRALTGKKEKDLTYRWGFDYDGDMTTREMQETDVKLLPFKCEVLGPAKSDYGAIYEPPTKGA